MTMDEIEPAIDVRGFNLWYGTKQALFDVSMPIAKNRITALIGPSGCGKSTLLRSMNRMNDLVDGVGMSGGMMFEGKDIYGSDVDVNVKRIPA
ncbi:MAG: ATP-binding cassette domain-containing protein, partial [Candidatus Methanomethylophilaceae archaeon]|nr:ATP-binding cassette domain-containing protein [Candidatus Methanomethylophilaceae archaeon]